MIRKFSGVLFRYRNDFVLINFSEDWAVLFPSTKIGDIILRDVEGYSYRGKVVSEIMEPYVMQAEAVTQMFKAAAYGGRCLWQNKTIGIA